MLAWDYPVTEKSTVSDCHRGQVFHHDQNKYSVISSMFLYRYENGKVKSKTSFWKENVRLVTSKGFVITVELTEDNEQSNSAALPLALPLASTAMTHARLASRVATLLPFNDEVDRMHRFLPTGISQGFVFSLGIYSPELEPLQEAIRLGDLCGRTGCWEYEVLLFEGINDTLHVVWVPYRDGEKNAWNYVIRTVNLTTGKPMGPATDLLTSRPYLEEPIGDRIREAIESPRLYSNNVSPDFTKTRAILYENRKVVAKAAFDIRDRGHQDFNGDCRFGSIRLEIPSHDGVKSTEIVDDAFNAMIAKSCTKRLPRLYVANFQLERRPGGGFLVLIELRAGEHRPEMAEPAGFFYREYTADGKTAGPVRKVSFRAVSRVSDTAWRAEKGCSWELRERNDSTP